MAFGTGKLPVAHSELIAKHTAKAMAACPTGNAHGASEHTRPGYQKYIIDSGAGGIYRRDRIFWRTCDNHEKKKVVTASKAVLESVASGDIRLENE